MKARLGIVACAALVGAMTLTGGAAGEMARTVNLVGQDNLTFSLPTITAKPNELLKVVLRTMSMQPPEQLKHNFVLLKPGVPMDRFIMDAAMAKATEHVPAAYRAQIVVATTMAAANETAAATFRTPAAAGTYPYVCTFPGHHSGGMKGTLIVK
jgi:azurin